MKLTADLLYKSCAITSVHKSRSEDGKMLEVQLATLFFQLQETKGCMVKWRLDVDGVKGSQRVLGKKKQAMNEWTHRKK